MLTAKNGFHILNLHPKKYEFKKKKLFLMPIYLKNPPPPSLFFFTSMSELCFSFQLEIPIYLLEMGKSTAMLKLIPLVFLKVKYSQVQNMTNLSLPKNNIHRNIKLNINSLS